MHGYLILLLLPLVDLHLQKDLLLVLLLLLEQKNLLLLGIVRVHDKVVWLHDWRYHPVGKGHVLLLHYSRLVLDGVLGASSVAGPMISLQRTSIVSVTLHKVVAVHIDINLQRAIPRVVLRSLHRDIVVGP